MMNNGKFSNRKETEYPGQLHFHYNREERLKNLSPEVLARDSKPRFSIRRNRGLFILFIDILFLLVLFFVVMPMLNRFAGHTEFMGYKMRLSAFMYDDETFLSLRITPDSKDDTSSAEEFVTVRFTAEGSEDAEEIIDMLPLQPDEERIIRGKLTGGRKKRKAFAEVIIGDESEILKTEIKPEQD